MDFKYLFTSLEGRINRKAYWLAALVLFAISIVVQLGVYFTAGMQAMLVIGLLFFWPGFALAVKRAHDRNRPTWLVAAFFAILLVSQFLQIAGLHENDAGEPSGLFQGISLVFLAFAVYSFVDWGCLKGTTGPNQYGPDPLQS